MMRTAKDNAAEFGALIKQGKDVRLALLVACSVERGTAGRPPKIVAITTNTKVSAKEFARIAGTSADRVIRHLEAWDRFAALTDLPTTTDLTPTHAETLVLAEHQIDIFNAKITLGNSTKDAIKGNPGAVADLLANDPEFVAKVILRNADVVSAIMGCDLVTPDQFLEGLESDDTTRRRGPTKPRDYGRLVESAINNLGVALIAAKSGRWEPTPVDEMLLYFATRMLGERLAPEAVDLPAKLSATLDEIEQYANAGGGK